jgi:hypothetical protein
MARRWIAGFAIAVLYFFLVLSVAKLHPLPRRLTVPRLLGDGAIYAALLLAANCSIKSVTKDRKKSN